MKSIFVFASLAALSAACVSSGCSSSKDDDKDTGGTSSGATSGTGGDSNAAGEPGSGATSSKGGDNGAAGDTAAGGDDTGSGGASSSTAITSCTSGVLFAGDPLYNDKPEVAGPVPAGQGLLDDPPIRQEAMAVIGSHLFVETETEIWTVDMSAAKPKLVRIAGQDDAKFVNAGVACKDTTFLVIRDMAATPDGKLVVVDYVGGAVIEISDPGGPNCKSEWVAGTHVKTADPGQDYPLAKGDVDGPGADALFGGPEKDGAGIHKVAVDPDGNIYTWDEGTGKFKMIATDADRTVSTIGVGATDDNVMGLAFLNGKLYVTGVDGTNDFLKEVDPAKYDEAKPKANVVDIFRNRDQFAETEGGHQAVISQVYSDGEALLISSQSGYVWRVAPDGTELAVLAGSGAFIDYEGDFDPLIEHPATEWQLVSKLSNPDGGPWLALDGKNMFWSGGLGIGLYTLQFSCK